MWCRGRWRTRTWRGWQQAWSATVEITALGLKGPHLLIDHDAKFTGAFDAVWSAEGCEVRRVGPRAPNMKANAER